MQPAPTATHPLPRVARTEATRAHILKTALDLFARKGFDNTTMRDVAREAGVAIGASYYYFDSKASMILAFYQKTQEESTIAAKAICTAHTDPETRLRAIFLQKLEQMSPHRETAKVLVRFSLDVTSPLSPFSPETAEIRSQSIQIIEQALNGAPFKSAEVIKPHLPLLFWILQMGLILFWIFDESPEQKRTQKFIDDGLRLTFQLLRFSRLPFTGRLWKPVLELLKEINLIPATPPVATEGTTK